MQEDCIIKVKFMTEKILGHGEDAPPLLMEKGNAYVVGVFDGMGGSGAATCESEYGNDHTKAYVASRIVVSALELYLANHLSTDDVTIEDIKAVIAHKLKDEQDKYPPLTKTMLRSKLVREYPTTMAVVILIKRENAFCIDSYWAGDSRCYLWKKDGFYQISNDDLEEENDPMENLRNDAAISNCICADRDFHINCIHINLDKEPVAILSATDGCFGYFPTPMHFEHMLKSCLRKSKNEKDWQEKVSQCIQKVTGDDTSLSLIGVGFNSFEQFKNKMTSKSKSVSSIKRIKVLEDDILRLKKELEQTSSEYEKAISSGWESYKHDFMKFINIEGGDDA